MIIGMYTGLQLTVDISTCLPFYTNFNFPKFLKVHPIMDSSENLWPSHK